MSHQQGYPPAPAQPEQPIHNVRIQEDKKANGVGVAALVVGIVAAALAVIPLLGMVAFFLGPVAIVLGIIGLILKNRKKGMAIAGSILGVVGLIVAGLMTAAISAGVDAVDKSINAEHTVEYIATTTGPAGVSYWTGGGSSNEDITADWKKTITSSDINITSLTVSGDYSDSAASVSCEIFVDGQSIAKNTGSGAGARATCSGSTWTK